LFDRVGSFPHNRFPMNYIEAIILAIIEGLTEFLPISSTGHMIIASSLMGIASQTFTKTFIVTTQLGAILSVVVIYWRHFIQSFNFYLILVVAFIPSAVMGFLLSNFIDQVFGRVEVVGFALVLGGVFLLFVDDWFKDNEGLAVNPVGFKPAFVIGCFQCLAIFLPGLSRSAATIIGGLSQKLDRKSAAEFSFFLAVPTMFGASMFKLFQFWRHGNLFGHDQINLLLVGNVVAFVVAWIAIRSFINFLNKHGFKLFGYYRISLGLLILILYYAGFQFEVL
jgi:undecaprenyl-diphosphatase